MQARLQNDGAYSEQFPVTHRVKQDCLMAPTLFSMMFSAMIKYAFQDCDAGFPIRYRFDDLAENATPEGKMQYTLIMRLQSELQKPLTSHECLGMEWNQEVLLLWIFYVFVLSCVCYVFVRVCLYVFCGHLLGKG